MHETQGLFATDPGHPPPSRLSKRAFAEAIGVSPGRVSQLIAKGLPVEPGGRINLAAGRSWYRANVDPNRRRADLDQDLGFGLPTSPKAKRDAAEAELARMKADRMAGRLLDRGAVLRTVEARAKFERDALVGWVNRAAPALAAATGADLAAVTAVLDREVRDHLAALADRPLELPR